MKRCKMFNPDDACWIMDGNSVQIQTKPRVEQFRDPKTEGPRAVKSRRQFGDDDVDDDEENQQPPK